MLIVFVCIYIIYCILANIAYFIYYICNVLYIAPRHWGLVLVTHAHSGRVLAIGIAIQKAAFEVEIAKPRKQRQWLAYNHITTFQICDFFVQML